MSKKLDIALPVPDGGIGQVPGYLTEIGLHDSFNLTDSLRLLGQDYLANHGIHVGIGKFNSDRETSFELLEIGRARNSCLPGAYEEKFPTHMFAA